MSKTFIEATLVDGTKVVGEFTRLNSGFAYMHRVANGEAFNGWKTVGTTHPASGEQVLVRTLAVIPSKQIVSLTQVDENGAQVQVIKKGPYGRHRFTADTLPEGATAGIDYPVHRDPVTLRKYVILNATGETPVVWYLDGLGASAPDAGISRVGDDEGSDDFDDDGDEDEDDDVSEEPESEDAAPDSV